MIFSKKNCYMLSYLLMIIMMSTCNLFSSDTEYHILYDNVRSDSDSIKAAELKIQNNAQNKQMEIRFSGNDIKYTNINYYIEIYDTLDVLLIVPKKFDDYRKQIAEGDWYICKISGIDLYNIKETIRKDKKINVFEDYYPSRIFSDHNDDYQLYYFCMDNIYPFYFSVANTKILSDNFNTIKYIADILLMKNWQKVIGNYKYKKLDGFLTFYRKNSNVVEEFIQFKDNERNGICYDLTVGDQRNYIEYKNGKKHGDAFTFYNNGMLRFHSTYINDVKVGEFLEYYESGKIKSIVMYSEGKPNGISTDYDENGNVVDSSKLTKH